MVRYINHQKIQMASDLLIERISINKIREKLKEKFGSAMSPNKIIQIRQGLILSGLITKETSAPEKLLNDNRILSIPSDTIHSLNHTVLENHRKIKKIDIFTHKVFDRMDIISEGMDIISERMKLFEAIFEQAEFLIEKTGQIEEKMESLQNSPGPIVEKSSKDIPTKSHQEKPKKLPKVKLARLTFSKGDARRQYAKDIIISYFLNYQQNFTKSQLMELTTLEEKELDNILQELTEVAGVQQEIQYSLIKV